MKVGRKKSSKRILQFYKINFSVEPPYRVLVDGCFVREALKQKLNIKEELGKIFNGRVTPIITTCLMEELRRGGEKFIDAAVMAKNFYRFKCGHPSREQEELMTDGEGQSEVAAAEQETPSKGKLPPVDSPKVEVKEEEADVKARVVKAEVEEVKKTTEKLTSGFEGLKSLAALSPAVRIRRCFLDIVGSENAPKFVVATQDGILKGSLKQIPGVPVLSFYGTMALLDAPAKHSVKKWAQMEVEKCQPAAWETKVLPSLQKTESLEAKKRRKKREKNPLSCKKKMTKGLASGSTTDSSGAAKKRVRTKRKRSKAAAVHDAPATTVANSTPD